MSINKCVQVGKKSRGGGKKINSVVHETLL